MFEYFWKQQDDIPQGMGYPLFGTTHFLSSGVTLLAVIAVILWVIRLDEKKQRRFLIFISIFPAVLEIIKDVFLVTVHRFGLNYLPLHFCSLGIFVFPLMELLPVRRVKEVLGEAAFMLIMPGAVAALIFPNWTVFYPTLNFMNLHSYLWHALLVLYPLLLFLRGEIRPRLRHIHYLMLFLLIVVPPVYAFDKYFGYNFFFINYPLPDTPLEWLASFMGNPGYLIGYAGLLIAGVLVLYMILKIVYFLTQQFNTRYPLKRT